MADIEHSTDAMQLALHMSMAADMFLKGASDEQIKTAAEAVYPLGGVMRQLAQEQSRYEELDRLAKIEKTAHGRQQRDAHDAGEALSAQLGKSLLRTVAPYTVPAHITHISLGDLSQAIVVRHGGQIGVYFRQTSNMTEFGNDATIGYHPESAGGNVGQGYADTLAQTLPRSFSQEWQDLTHGNGSPPSFQQAIEKQVRQEMAGAKAEGLESEITLAGISRGGALAQLTASRWMEAGDLPVRRVYAVSSPMAGDQNWADRFNKMAKDKGVSALRMEIGGDIVPHLPPVFYAPAGKLLYYAGAPELGNKPVFQPSQDFLDRDRALITTHNHEQGRSDFRQSIEFHFSGAFIDAYISRISAISKIGKAERGGDFSEAMRPIQAMVISGGSSEEAALLRSVPQSGTPIGPLATPPVLLPRQGPPAR